MREPIETKINPETAILIGVIEKYQDAAEVEEYLQELAFLVETAGAIPRHAFTQQLEHQDPRIYLFSKGNKNTISVRVDKEKRGCPF